MSFPIVTAGGGPQAVDYLKGACNGDPAAIPAVIFLDIRMPGLDGFDVLRWMRTEKQLSPVKVIILSSSDDPSDAKTATELGVHGYLIKQPNSAVLACILREALRGWPAPGPRINGAKAEDIH